MRLPNLLLGSETMGCRERFQVLHPLVVLRARRTLYIFFVDIGPTMPRDNALLPFLVYQADNNTIRNTTRALLGASNILGPLSLRFQLSILQNT